MTTKDKVLSHLERHKGQFLSGAKIAKEIGVSRNAVWKVMKQLEEQGYPIEAVTNKGYRLLESSDVLSLQGIAPFLEESLNSSQIHFYETIDSTNKQAKEFALQGAEHGTVVIANEQTDGRGRYGRTFESPEDKGIYMSLIIKPNEWQVTEPGLITSYVAVVVANVLEELTGKKVGIKWVNDLFINGKKVCGILTEAVTDFESGNIEWIVIGIGINVTTQAEDLTDSVKQIATSLYGNKEARTSRNDIIGTLLNHLLQPSYQMSIESMLDSYREKSLVVGKVVRVHRGQETFEAMVKDINDSAELVLELNDGTVKVMNSGEISIKL